jgi:hypothetical protein
MRYLVLADGFLNGTRVIAILALSGVVCRSQSADGSLVRVAWPLLGLAPFSDANPLMMARRIVEADFAPIDDGRYSDRLKVHSLLTDWTAPACECRHYRIGFAISECQLPWAGRFRMAPGRRSSCAAHNIPHGVGPQRPQLRSNPQCYRSTRSAVRSMPLGKADSRLSCGTPDAPLGALGT